MRALPSLKPETREMWLKRERLKVKGISPRAYAVLRRAYFQSFLDKPLKQVTDAEFLSLYGLGVKTLAEIRQLIPAPEGG